MAIQRSGNVPIRHRVVAGGVQPSVMLLSGVC